MQLKRFFTLTWRFIRQHIFRMKLLTWTVYEVTKIDHRSGNDKKELVFFLGDTTLMDVESNFNTSTLVNKAGKTIRSAKLLGLTIDTRFPIKYPFTLENGVELQGIYAKIEEETEHVID